MRPFLRPVFGIALAAMLAGCSHGMSGVAPGAGSAANQSMIRQSSVHPLFSGSIRPDGSAEVCGQARPGFARCMSLIRLGVQPDAGGYGPADLISAYKLPAAKKLQTVAIVDAFDDPNAESDLGVYRSHFGLPACTTGNGCFRKVNQRGLTSPLPPPNVGWAEEISLDVDMVSAICPTCHILLVEGDDNSFKNLALSVDRAAKMHANAISNSYGGGESGGASQDSHYNHPGHMITASSGDGGYGVIFPSSSQYVTAVGGTRLVKAGNARGWTETVWAGAGSGCSSFETKPSWQTDTGCSRRTVSDTSADADPATGVLVYDSYGITPGFYIFGGTSVSSPIIASVYALAGNSRLLIYASRIYSHTSRLYDVTSGSNGSCGGSYLCTGKVGYDGPTGWGTPHGIGAF